jgi:hypothetical protein
MTAADDALFEPFSGPVIKTAGILSSGITKTTNTTTIEINRANPVKIYMDAADDMTDVATRCHPQMFDVRKTTAVANLHNGVAQRLGAWHLSTLVATFHVGQPHFWVSCPHLTQPKRFEFTGKFGHYKVWRFAQKIQTTQIAQFVAEWFWLETTEGQLSAIELGILLMHPTIPLHHLFSNEAEARTYYNS